MLDATRADDADLEARMFETHGCVDGSGGVVACPIDSSSLSPLCCSVVCAKPIPPDVVLLAVRWYLRYGLSYRDVEELLAERGIEVDQNHRCERLEMPQRRCRDKVLRDDTGGP